MLITIQIVNYNSRDNLKICLDSVRENLPDGMGAQMIVINNETKSLPSGDIFFPGVEIVEAKENLGFGRAHNLGAKTARGKYIFFLNPDAKIFPDSLSRLVEVLEADEKIGIVGPALVGESGKTEEEHAGFEKTFLSLAKSKFLPGRKSLKKEAFSGLLEVDWVSGGAMLARKEAFFELGGFDENFFMYFEDVDFCRRAKKKGYRVFLNPLAKVFHKSGQSFLSSRSKKKYYYASQDYYLRKNFGPFQAGMAKLFRLPFYVKNVYLSK